jgi:hypothetical protein
MVVNRSYPTEKIRMEKCNLICCNFRCDLLLLMDVNEWMGYKCSDEVHMLKTFITDLLVHICASGENRTRNRSENCKCKGGFPVLARSSSQLAASNAWALSSNHNAKQFILIRCKHSHNLVPRACDPWEGNEGSGIIHVRNEYDWLLVYNGMSQFCKN